MPNQLETLIVERDEGVVTVTMNRPAGKNAANGRMWRELLETFEAVAADRHDRVMVLTGAGDAFCSGADLGDPSDVAGRLGDPVRRLTCSMPTGPHPRAQPLSRGSAEGTPRGL
jgi:enoyl-CoA hydratase/carnithine racemase